MQVRARVCLGGDREKESVRECRIMLVSIAIGLRERERKRERGREREEVKKSSGKVSSTFVAQVRGRSLATFPCFPRKKFDVKN